MPIGVSDLEALPCQRPKSVTAVTSLAGMRVLLSRAERYLFSACSHLPKADFRLVFGLIRFSKMPLLDHLVGSRAQRSRIVRHAV